MNYDYLWEYFVYYQMTENNKKKKKIMDAFLEYIYSGEAFHTKESYDILFGNLYEDRFDIKKNQKHLFIKWCVKRMFDNYLDEEEYEKKSFEKGLKRVNEISDKCFYDTDITEVTLPDSLRRIGRKSFNMMKLVRINKKNLNKLSLIDTDMKELITSKNEYEMKITKSSIIIRKRKPSKALWKS